MFQYAKLEHVTLPSVESWGTNNNILKDPPKAIVTRRIDKVSDTQNIVELIDESGDRICEGINVYARGTNPFVAVSYDNFSNNAGIAGSITKTSGNVQASLPYKVMRDGVFRPPVQNPRDLMPLSRQPRLVGEKFTNPGFVNFAMQRNCGTSEQTKFRQIKSEVIRTSVRPTAVFTLEKPIEHFDINYAIIDDPLKYAVNAGYRGTDRTNLVNINPVKGANNQNNTALAFTNYGSSAFTKNSDNEINTTKYIQDAVYGTNVISNPSANINSKSLNEVSYLDEDRYIKDHLQGSYMTNMRGHEINQEFGVDEDQYIKDVTYIDHMAPISGIEKRNIFSDEIYLDRTLPQWQATTNYSDSRISKNIEHENELMLERNTPLTAFQSNVANYENIGTNFLGSRDFKLPPSLPVGGFEGRATIPAFKENGENISLNDERRKFHEKVFMMSQGRQLN